MIRDYKNWKDIEWSRVSMVHNLFRLYEYLFGRKNGIRIENATWIWFEAKQLKIRRKFYTWEAQLVFIEQLPRIAWLNYQRWLGKNLRLNPFFLCEGAVGFDAATTDAGITAAISFSHTTSGSNRGIFLTGGNDEGGITMGAVKYAAVALALSVRNDGGAGAGNIEMHELVAPATGANTAEWSWSSEPPNDRQSGVAVSFTGVSQTDIVGATATATGTTTSATVDLTTTVSNSWVLDSTFSRTGGSTATVGAGQTSRWNYDQPGATSPATGSTEETTNTATVTMSWSYNQNTGWRTLAVEVKEAAAIVVMNRIPLLGVG